jgi:heme/copper-type cytochrome/quinol oxidase subunit 2
MKRFLAATLLLGGVTRLLAQTATPSSSVNAGDAAAAAAVGGVGVVCCFLYFLLIAGLLAAWVCVAIWIMRDAKSRQSENAQLVTILGWLVPLVGLIVHLATRPNVKLVECPNCKKKRIEGSAICPHCGRP